MIPDAFQEVFCQLQGVDGVIGYTCAQLKGGHLVPAVFHSEPFQKCILLGVFPPVFVEHLGRL
jgi:hypothetical protein